MGKELIDRATLERIIQRAAELQAAQREIGEGLSEGEVLQLGREVGIPERFLQQAMLEVRARPDSEARGPAVWLAGPALVSADRVVPGGVDEVARTVDTWMRDEEGLATLRRSQGHLRWERQPGFVAEMRRSFGAGGRAYILARADEVAAYLHRVDDGFSYVRLVANVRGRRGGRVGGATSLLALGVLATAASTAMGIVIPLAVAPVAAGAAFGVVTLRRHIKDNRRMQIALERVLDRLEAGEPKPEHALPRRSPAAHLVDRVADELRRALQ